MFCRFALCHFIISSVLCAYGTDTFYSSCTALPPIPREREKMDESYEYLIAVTRALKDAHICLYSDKEIVDKAIRGLLSTLDPHSSYLDEKQYKDIKEKTSGEFCGLGIQIAIDAGIIRVVAPVDDTPAHKAGLRPGDKIVCIDGNYVEGLSSDEAVSKLRGKKGSIVVLKIVRDGAEPFDVSIKRDVIKVKSVKTEVIDGVLYARISTFDEKVSQLLKDGIKKANISKIKGVILDMRDNGGGLLTEACNVADMFLDGGCIVETKGKDPANYNMFSAKKGDILNGLPIVALVNSNTASAPEIVAGALRDNKRAVVVGTRTFGKGSVQRLVPLSETTALKVTVAMHYTPSGTCIQAKGITPDIEVKPAYIKQAENYVELREENLRNSLKQERENFVENNQQKAINKENVTEKNSIEKAFDVVKSIFSKQASSKEDIKKKLEDISKKKEKDDSFEYLYRTITLEERKQKDLQLRTAFYVIETMYYMKDKTK